MSNSEFDIIQRYFTLSKRSPRKDVIVSIGDDCAIVEHRQNQRIAITTDTMVENIHFLPSISASDLAYKLVASNLSDLAAMGAEPAWFSLALTLPKIDEDWLSEFSQSFFNVLDHYNVDLIGGDTTKGSIMVLSLTAQGIVPKGKALCRHSGKVGDWIYVTGTLGDSAAGLDLLLQGKSAVKSEEEFLIKRHLRPTPRVLFGLELSTFFLANAAIDISDGLVADLGHILERSDCNAIVDLDKLPLSSALVSCVGKTQAEKLALTGGEDYELCFTVPHDKRAKLDRYLAHIGVPYTCIGQLRSMNENKKQRITFQRNGEDVKLENLSGFDHFK